MNNTHDLYEEVVNQEVDRIGDYDLGSDEHKKVVSDLSQLTDRLIRLKELDIEHEKIELEKEKKEADAKKVEIESERVEIEKEKIELEREKIKADEQKAKIESERVAIERQKMVEERKNEWIRNRITALGILVPAGITITGMVLMFLFEEKGTITSGAGRKIVDRMFRSK
jgi:hypothetical protein